MYKELSFVALVLKKQPLGEADEIITLFSEEEGKVRAVSKSSKLSTSKLQYSLQPLFLTKVALAGRGSLPKLIQASTIKIFTGILKNPDKIAVWFVVAEFLIKLLPDGQPNQDLYKTTVRFLEFLDTVEVDKEFAEFGLLKYKIEVLKAVGLGIHIVPSLESGRQLMFSSSKGGFYYNATSSNNGFIDSEGVLVSDGLWKQFNNFDSTDYNDLKTVSKSSEIDKLTGLVSQFVSYQLDREIKAEKYL